MIDPSGAVLESGDLDAGYDRDAHLPAFAVKALDRVHVECEAALVLVEARGDTLRAPVGEEGFHVRVDVRLPEDQLRAVSDPLLSLEGFREIRLLDRRPEGDVADGVVRVGLGVGLPHLDARLHELAHRGLEVVVADDAARDPRGAGAGVGLVEDDDVGARALRACGKLLGEVIGGRETVDAGSDDDVGGVLRTRHLLPPRQQHCRSVDKT